MQNSIINNNDKVIINLFGESFKIYSLNISTQPDILDVLQQISIQLNEPLENALLNVNFFRLFNERINTDETYNLQNFIKDSFGGLVSNKKSNLEIYKERKKKQKFNLNDLFNPNTLFPLFHVHLRNINLKLSKNIFLIETEVGLIGHYEIKTNKFDIEKLKFEIANVRYINESYQLLLTIYYDAKILNPIKSDTLISHQHIVSFLD